MRHPTTRLDQLGTASLEAVIVLLVLLVIYVGVTHVTRLQHGALLARAQARRCAWKHANAGCRGDVPSGCEDAEPHGVGVEASSDGEASVLDAFTDLDVLADVFESVLGRAVDMHITRAVMTPSTLGGEQRQVRARIYVLCNERNRTMHEIAMDTACALLPSGTFFADVMRCHGGRR